VHIIASISRTGKSVHRIQKSRKSRDYIMQPSRERKEFVLGEKGILNVSERLIGSDVREHVSKNVNVIELGV
jgi:hypothetical protein